MTNASIKPLTHPAWHCERIASLSASEDAPDLVLLHGWGMSSDVWRSWLALLRIRCNVILLDVPGFGRSPAQIGLSLDDLLDQLKNYIPPGAALLGWSLGGEIAIAFAQKFPEHCRALMTIASNPCFVARDDWPHAMPASDFAAFQHALAENPKAALQRFLGLQVRGGDNERELLRWLRRQPVCENADALRWGLDLLARLDLREALRVSTLPALHIYGTRDALVPAQVPLDVHVLAPEHACVLIDGAAHVPFISHAELCWQHLDTLLVAANLSPRVPMPQREKKSVAASFSRAARSYDSAAGLQRDVASRLLDQVTASVDIDVPKRLVDLGCGTGAATQRLAENHAVIALDLAQGMVNFARARNANRNIDWLCADAESLPLASDSIDRVFSSLALQWCENTGAVFFEIERVLRSGGSAFISTLGPQTLHELRSAWRAADERAHVNRFIERNLIEKSLARANLTLVSWREEMRVLRYRELRELTRELKDLGAHNVNSARPGGLTSRTRLQRFSDAYESLRDADNYLPATYQVWYLHLMKI